MSKKKIKYLVIAKEILAKKLQHETIRTIIKECKCSSLTAQDGKKFLKENPNINIEEINKMIIELL